VRLSEAQVRVLGAMIEKSHTTPDYYPLTLNGLVSACNQKSSRDPVVSYNEASVSGVLSELREKSLIYQVHSSSSRAVRYRQGLTEGLEISGPEEALLCVLMLRGPQTVGEMRGRTSRLHAFASLGEVDQTLEGLIERSLVSRLPRTPGRQATPYGHLLGDPDATITTAAPTARPPLSAPSASRVGQGEMGRIRMARAEDEEDEPETEPEIEPPALEVEVEVEKALPDLVQLQQEVVQLRDALTKLRQEFEAFRDR